MSQSNLEECDDVDVEAVLVEVSSRNPIRAEFRSNDDVRVRLDVHAKGRVVEGEITTRVEDERIGLPPFNTSTELDAIVDGVEQVLVDTNVVFTRRIDLQQIALKNVLEILGQVRGHNDAVRVSIATAEAGVANRGDVGQGHVIQQRCAETTQEHAAVAELIETSIPTGNPTTVQLEIVDSGVGRQTTRVGERLAVVLRVGVAVEEVIGSRHNFIAHEGEEVTCFNRPVLGGEFTIQLRQGPTVTSVRVTKNVGTVVPAVVVAAGVVVEHALGVAKGLRIGTVGTVNHVGTESPIPSSAAIRFGSSLCPEPLLLQVNLARTLVECEVSSLVISELSPTTEAP